MSPLGSFKVKTSLSKNFTKYSETVKKINSDAINQTAFSGRKVLISTAIEKLNDPRPWFTNAWRVKKGNTKNPLASIHISSKGADRFNAGTRLPYWNFVSTGRLEFWRVDVITRTCREGVKVGKNRIYKLPSNEYMVATPPVKLNRRNVPTAIYKNVYAVIKGGVGARKRQRYWFSLSKTGRLLLWQRRTPRSKAYPIMISTKLNEPKVRLDPVNVVNTYVSKNYDRIVQTHIDRLLESKKNVSKGKKLSIKIRKK